MSPDPPTPTPTGRIKVGPLDLSFGPHVASAIGVLVAIGLGVWGAFWVWDHLALDKVRVSKEFLLHQEEMQRHWNEPPAHEADFAESVHLEFFASDNCVATTRLGQGGIRSTKFSIDPARLSAAPSFEIGAVSDIVEVDLASIGPVGGCRPNTGRCASGCVVGYACDANLPGHPGEYAWWWGARNPNDGCWIEYWRRFGDCCTVVQWFNDCGQYWAPEVWWSYCVH